MTASKLPERPQEPRPDDYMLLHAQYWMGMSDFYRARMEALVRLLREVHASGCDSRLDMEIDELLAACERRKG